MTSECVRHALVVSALTRHKCLIGVVAHLALFASAPSLFLSDHKVLVCVATNFLCAPTALHDWLMRLHLGSS